MAKHAKKGHPGGGKIGGRHGTTTDLADKVIAKLQKMAWVTKIQTQPISQASGGQQRVTCKEGNHGILIVTVRMSGSVQKITVYTTWPKQVEADLAKVFPS
jgi:hypothetical protein